MCFVKKISDFLIIYLTVFYAAYISGDGLISKAVSCVLMDSTCHIAINMLVFSNYKKNC